jgi:hypothetical protein
MRETRACFEYFFCHSSSQSRAIEFHMKMEWIWVANCFGDTFPVKAVLDYTMM